VPRLLRATLLSVQYDDSSGSEIAFESAARAAFGAAATRLGHRVPAEPFFDTVAVELAGPPCAIMDTTRWLWCDPVATLPGGIAAPIAKILSAERPFSLSRTEPRA